MSNLTEAIFRLAPPTDTISIVMRDVRGQVQYFLERFNLCALSEELAAGALLEVVNDIDAPMLLGTQIDSARSLLEGMVGRRMDGRDVQMLQDLLRSGMSFEEARRTLAPASARA